MRTKTAVSAKLIARNPVEAAIRLSRPVEVQEIEQVESKLENAKEALELINKFEATLLPVERGILPKIHDQKASIEKEVQELENQAKDIRRLNRFSRYRSFSLEPLTWRSKDGFPRLAVFSLGSPFFEISAEPKVGLSGSYTHIKINPKLPPDMIHCYEDVIERVTKLADKADAEIRLSAQFAMLIPDNIKKEISQVRYKFNDIFLIAEVPKWDLKKREVLNQEEDPLVVGYDGVDYWLIAAFYPTPLEDYIQKEFCIKPLLLKP